MKALKLIVFGLVLSSTLTSCYVVRRGHRHSDHYYHRHHMEPPAVIIR